MFSLSHFFFLLLLVFTNSQNIFIAKKNGSYVCVTNSSSSLSWNLNGNSSLTHVSHYIPQLPYNVFDCNITSDFKTSKYFLKRPWFLRQSQDWSSNNTLILDRRWEEMQVYTTTFQEMKILEYIPVMSNLKLNFDIPFSVRLAYEAHIFLCDGENPPESNCYWFILDGFMGTRSGIRKCGKGTIPSQTTEFPVPPCSDFLNPQNQPPFRSQLDQNLWKHFKLTKSADYLSLSAIDNGQNFTLLELRDDSIEISYMYIHSKYANGFWKIHEIDFIYTNEESNDTKLGAPISVKDGSVCISMLLSMCDSCKLKLKLNSDGFLIREETFHQQTNNLTKWAEIKFIIDNIANNIHINKVDLLVSTIAKNKSESFWAIDKVRVCQQEEFRMITLPEEASCQLVENTHQNISFNSTLELVRNDCSEDTIGTFCVPCHYVFDNCDSIKICTEHRKQTGCWCSAGFRNLPDCQDMCYRGHYGHGCTQRCQNCYDPDSFMKYEHFHARCDVRNGTCSSCIEKYVGPKCDRLQVMPPYDLRIRWSSNNEMVLEWKQPNVTESKIEKFHIFVYTSRNVTNPNGFDFNQTLAANQAERNFTYFYKVNASLLPSTRYRVRVVAVNKYGTNSVTMKDTSPPEVPSLCSEPKLFCSFGTITLELISEANKTYNITVLVSDNSGNLYLHPELTMFGTDLESRFTKFRTVYTLVSFSGKFSMVVGDGGAETQNYPLVSSTPYNVSLIISARRDKISYKMYLLSCSTSSRNILLLNLLLLLLVPLTVLIFYLWRLKLKKRFQATKPSIANEECETQFQDDNLIKLKPFKARPISNKNRKNHNTYSYLNPVFPSRIISVKKFQKYVNVSEENGELDRQFKIIDNTKKIYDEIEGNHYFHYIDIIYVNGSVTPRAYIATKIPKADNINEFWTSIYDGNIKHIVLLSDQNQENFLRYWPELKESLEYDNITVQLVSKQTVPCYEYRTFVLRCKNEEKEVDQINFSYNGFSARKYVSFFKKLAEYSLNSSSPILIHSDSTKRIGLVLLCDMCLRTASEEGAVDVLKNFKRLSDQSADMTGDLRFYKLTHSIISEFIFGAELACNLVQVYNDLKRK